MPTTNHTLTFEGDGADLFVLLDGLKIAKRGHPGTPQAGTWVSIEPGYEVRDMSGGAKIEVRRFGVLVH
jgi:hypothetical protein